MKTISVVYRNRENLPALESLKSNLESIFENYVQINNVFLNELQSSEIIDSDVILILFRRMLNPLKKHIRNLNKVVVMTRGIDKRFISEIRNIPINTDVLVVNDCYESTVQTTEELYKLDIGHLNFIPYDENLDNTDYYNDISIAITPNEEHLVPKFIKNIINIGYRKIGYDSLIKIMETGQLNHKLINRNLIAHMNNIIEPNASFKRNYLNSYLKSEMLDRIIFNSKEAILLLDTNYNLVYSNNKSNKIFNIDFNDYANDININNFVDEEICKNLTECDFKGKLFKINGENYTVEKSIIEFIDQAVGYSIIFRNEKDIRDLESNLKDSLINKGLYAKYTFEDIIYKSHNMKQCITLSKKVALTDYTILIRGENGTGKELLAHSIHNFSSRKDMPFLAFNCAALPESLLESELFGYEGGSFTGARKNGKLGLFEQANKGTIFLDEIGDISPNLQIQLLRVIQEKQIMRIGSDSLINIDVRIIVATNKKLEEEIKKGNFRSDLYYRLNVLPIFIPSLKEKKEDILLLLEHFLGPIYLNVEDKEKEALLKYNWPGNVRELESASSYYKTLGEFPPNIFNNCFSANYTYSNVENLVLKTINDNSDSFNGIGRTKLYYELKKRAINLSDSKLRKVLSYLEKNNYIKTNRGRTGSQITQEGIDYLNR